MRSNNVIILILAIAMGGGAAYLARSWLQGQLDASASHQPASHIVVAAEPLAYGEVVTADNVSEIRGTRRRCPTALLRPRMTCSMAAGALCSIR